MSLQSSLRLHTRFGLDTSVFNYHINAEPPFAEPANDVLQLLTHRSATSVTSVVTLTELLVRPYQVHLPVLALQYEALVRAIPNLAVIDVDASIARRAATLRATYRLRMADAIQVATALEHGATAFVTNDVRLRRVGELAMILLLDYAI